VNGGNDQASLDGSIPRADDVTVRPYAAYKDSGQEWIGHIPTTWDVKPVKAVATCNDDVLDESTRSNHRISYIEISDVDSIAGVTASTDMEFASAPSRARRLVKDGDVIVSTVRTYLRAIAPMRNPATNTVVSTGFAVFRPRHIVPAFLAYIFRAEFLIAEIIARSVGVSYPAINASEISRLFIPVPPSAEQSAIAAFLDRETGKIDALVAEQERLMALLKEKRQAVISQAVTKGLNLNVKMKPSGVEWLGDVPQGWRVGHIKRFCRQITDGAHISPVTEGGVFDFVSTKDIDDNGINFSDCLKTSPESYEYMISTGCRPYVGDVLFSKDGTIGRAALVIDDHEFAVASSLIIIRPNKNIFYSRYLFWLLQSAVVLAQVECFVKGAGLPRLSIQNLLKVIGVLPPMVEQVEIACESARPRYPMPIADNLLSGLKYSAFRWGPDRRR